MNTTFPDALVPEWKPLVEAIREHAPGASVLIIDDNSPDGTGTIADGLRATLPNVHVLHRAGKLGLGTAIMDGMEFAIANGFDYVLNLDADFSHHPRYLRPIMAGSAAPKQGTKCPNPVS